jgi:hypothetical protein
MRFPWRFPILIASLLAGGAIFAAFPPPEFTGFKFVSHVYNGASCDYTLYVDQTELKAGKVETAFAVPTAPSSKLVREGGQDQRTIRNGHFAGALYMGFPFARTGGHRGDCMEALAAEATQIPGFPKHIQTANLSSIEFRLEKVSGVALAKPVNFQMGAATATTVLSYRGFDIPVDQILDKADVERIRVGQLSGGETVLTARLIMPAGRSPEVSWSLAELPGLVMADLRAVSRKRGQVTPADVQGAMRDEVRHLVSQKTARGVGGELDASRSEVINGELSNLTDGLSRNLSGSVLASELDAHFSEVPLNLDVLETSLKTRIPGQVSLTLPGPLQVFPARKLPALNVQVD